MNANLEGWPWPDAASRHLNEWEIEAAMSLLTAEEAVQLSGFEGELLLIDREMREQADKSLRFMCLRLERIAKSQMPHIIASLRHRGFVVEELNNPTRVDVTW